MAYPRSDWKARPARSLTRDGNKSLMVVHHSAGSGLSIDTRAEQQAAMRSIQNYHMDSNGWSDIGYALVVFQPRGKIKNAKAYWARPVWAVPAAQLGHNSGTIPVCVVANNEPISRATEKRLREIAENLHHAHGITGVRGHYQLSSTDCPGAHLKLIVPRLDRFVQTL